MGKYNKIKQNVNYFGCDGNENLCVYMIVFKDWKIYIGATTQNIKKRIQQHITSYPVKNTVSEELHNCDVINVTLLKQCKNVDELNYYEKLYIESYKSDTKQYGYNLKNGGGINHVKRNTMYRLKTKSKII